MYREIIAPGVDPTQPGLYEWRIEGVGIYIGRYSHASRPRREYGTNVARLLAKREYRKRNPDGFRHIHHHLALAAEARTPITLTFLENQPDKIKRNRRELELIYERREAARSGGLPVLNGG